MYKFAIALFLASGAEAIHLKQRVSRSLARVHSKNATDPAGVSWDQDASWNDDPTGYYQEDPAVEEYWERWSKKYEKCMKKHNDCDKCFKKADHIEGSEEHNPYFWSYPENQPAAATWNATGLTEEQGQDLEEWEMHPHEETDAATEEHWKQDDDLYHEHLAEEGHDWEQMDEEMFMEMGPAEQADLIFWALDANGDEVIDKEELTQGLKEFLHEDDHKEEWGSESWDTQAGWNATEPADATTALAKRKALAKRRALAKKHSHKH